MKYFCYIALSFILSACLHQKNDRVYFPASAYLPGMYTAYENAQFCSTIDTLIITHDTIFDNTYFIEQRATFQRKWYGLRYDPESEWTRWKSVFDRGSQTLNGIDGYPNIEYMPGQNALILNGMRYTKIIY
jgi:hypothetical protein